MHFFKLFTANTSDWNQLAACAASCIAALMNQSWQCDWRMEVGGVLTDAEIISALQEKVDRVVFFMHAHTDD